MFRYYEQLDFYLFFFAVNICKYLHKMLCLGLSLLIH